MRPRGPAIELETRREMALKLLAEGYGAALVAKLVNTTPRSVQRWRVSFRATGDAGIKAKPAKGRPTKLGQQNWDVLRAIISLESDGEGRASQSRRAMAELVRDKFNIVYSLAHISRLLAQLRKQTQRAEPTSAVLNSSSAVAGDPFAKALNLEGDALYLKLRSIVERKCRPFLLPRGVDRDDVVQEVMVRIIRQRSIYSFQSSNAEEALSGWISTAVRWTAADLWRKERRFHPNMEDSSVPFDLEPLEAPDSQLGFEAGDLIRFLKEHLTPRELIVAELLADGFSLRKIANRIHLSRSSISRIRLRISAKAFRLSRDLS